jgi:hypothetical protein
MINRTHLLFVLLIFGVTSINIRVLLEENCAKEGFIDADGKIQEMDCPGCKKICVKCEEGFYLNKRYRCRKLPNNCAEANVDGDCIRCEKEFFLNKNKRCRRLPENCK